MRLLGQRGSTGFGALALALATLPACGPASEPAGGRAGPAASFTVEPGVFRPTSATATLHWSTSERLEARVLCGASRDDLDVCAETDASEPTIVELTGLEPDAEVWYRLQIRPPAGQWSDREAHRFRTARRPGQDYNVALLADAHLQNCLRRPGSFENLDATIAAILGDRPDFVIFLGDEPGVHHTRDTRGEMSQEAALARWRRWREVYARLLETVPSFFVVGNHEGEAGFYREHQRSGRTEYLQRWGTIARKRYFLNPLPTTYPEGGEDEGWVGESDSPATGGADQGNRSPLENYFAWSWGDALVVVLDVHRYTRVGLEEPDSPNQWTLGPTQLEWLEKTLRDSSARWKFVLAHHVVGGWEYDLTGQTKETDYAYGRGGARYARVGEQERITELMQRYGAQVFFYGHDHVFAHQNAEGIDFVCGGRPTYLQPKWWDTPGWLEAYGAEGASDAPPYYGAIGFTRLRVSADEIQVEYVCTARDPRESENVPVTPGEVLYRFVRKGTD